MAENALKSLADNLPESPGAYMFLDEKGEVLYVGKAASLRGRVRSYFQSGRDPKTEALMNAAKDIRFIVTSTEMEAIMLECNLIKKHRPRYNIMLRDDKHYPYLRVGTDHRWPRVTISRSARKDGARYFGPYYPAGSVSQTLKLLKSLFPLRTCSDRILANAQRPCLNYHIKRCPAPCMGLVDDTTYQASVRDVCLFLDGKHEDVRRSLIERMQEAAERLEFEKAADYRDQIRAIERIMEEQKAVSTDLGDQDVVGIARWADRACVLVQTVRSGRLVGQKHYLVDRTLDVPTGEILASFLKQHYEDASYIPPVILLPAQTEEEHSIQDFLSSKRNGRIRLHVPKRGEKARLVEMARENAEALLQAGITSESKAEKDRALAELASVLGLDAEPHRIEGFDISNIQGQDPVGCMVVFIDGRPAPRYYRRFKVGSVQGPNDVAMMGEVIGRRFARSDSSEWRWPDLVLVDGGKGQLHAALSAMDGANVTGVPVLGLAKEEEEIWLPGTAEPLRLPRISPALRLLQRVRDEAHRFALGYHRSLRSRRATGSVLDEIPGIGPKRKKVLMRAFGSLRAIREASEEELARLPGMNSSAARRVKEYLE
ncbi:MAG: excinuclease ABC subunit UvrC [Bacillota bacterium]